jgi:hypothetical protein
MKKNLGKIILLLLLSALPLYAHSLASYTLQADKKQATIKEPVVLTFVAKQTDHSDNMFFQLHPQKSEDYEIHLLTKESDDTQKHNASTTFTYILFPLKAKALHINFDFIIQTASDAAVAQSYVDDHDGGKAVPTHDTLIHLKPLVLQATPIPDVDLVGDFTLHAQCTTKNITQYDDTNIIYTITGKGYKNKKKDILTTIDGVSIFKEVHESYLRLTKEGYISKKVYTYALSAKENFRVPAIKIKAYSPTTHKVYYLTAPSYAITLKKVNPLSLVDKEEYPQSKDFIDLQSLKTYFIYLFLFAAGFLTAKIDYNPFTRAKKEERFHDIKTAKGAKELLAILLKNYANAGVEKYIDALEDLEYAKAHKSFKQIKKEILTFLNA